MRLRLAWQRSLRFRLLAMGLMPLLLAFPLVIAALLTVGGSSGRELVAANLRVSLAGGASYLQQVRDTARLRLEQLARSERLAQLLLQQPPRQALEHALQRAAQDSGLDFLILATTDGTVLAGSHGAVPGSRLPPSYVVRQARDGVANVAYERLEASELDQLLPQPAGGTARTEAALLINAAAHLPLSIRLPDAMLFGGIVINRNHALLDHMREVLFPLGSLPGDIEGMTAIYLGPTSVAASRLRLQGHAAVGLAAPQPAVQHTLTRGETWIGAAELAGQSHAMGFAPLVNGDGQPIGMLAASMPDWPYKRAIWLALGSVAGLLALALLALSLVVLRSGSELTQRLESLRQTMNAVRAGRREARVGSTGRDDELGQLARHFDELLETIADYRQQLEQRVEQRTRELGERTVQLNTILELSPDGFVSFDRQQRIGFANAAFIRMTGLSDAELIGLDERGLAERLAGRSVAGAAFPGMDALRQAAEERDRFVASRPAPLDGARGSEATPRQVFELALPRRRVLEVGLRLSEAESVSQVLYLRDITHETEVDRIKSEFLATAAHELRTPMTSIHGFVELLRTREMSKDRRDELLAIVTQQSSRMVAILNQLLDLARIEARQGQDFEMRPVPLRDIVVQGLAALAPTPGRDAPQLEDIPAELIVNADQERMVQALLNVLSNAYKYSPQGGSVLVQLRRSRDDGRPMVGLAISDHGIGMNEEQQARVCERFYRADSSGNIPGTGLGMAIVSEIIALHGGRIEISSQPGRGSTFVLWLPELEGLGDTALPAADAR